MRDAVVIVGEAELGVVEVRLRRQFQEVTKSKSLQMIADVTASRFHVMGVVEGSNASWKKFVCTIRWSGQVTQVTYITQATDIVVIVGNLSFGLLCLCSATRGHEPPHPRPLHSPR